MEMCIRYRLYGSLLHGYHFRRNLCQGRESIWPGHHLRSYQAHVPDHCFGGYFGRNLWQAHLWKRHGANDRRLCGPGSVSYTHLAATIVDCELYCIPKDQFLYHLSQDTALNVQVLSSMAHKIHLLMEHIRRLCFLDARSRVAAVFVDLVHVFGVPTKDGIKVQLPVIQQGIGNLVKASRLTVNQVIGEFEAMGLLEKKQNRWIIYNLDMLKEFSKIP